MKSVSGELNDMFVYRTGIDFTSDAVKKDLELLGPQINMRPRELVLIYMDIKEKYKFDFSQAVGAGYFNTYNNILKIINESLQNN